MIYELRFFKISASISVNPSASLRTASAANKNRVNQRESVSELVFCLAWIPVFTGMTGGLVIYDLRFSMAKP